MREGKYEKIRQELEDIERTLTGLENLKIWKDIESAFRADIEVKYGHVYIK